LNSVRWDRETGGVLLASAFSTGAVDVITGAARPVFWEELDLLGLSKTWKYPHVSEPLLWAVDRRYYYRGDPVLDVHGGGMTTEPKLTFINTSRLRLRPVDVSAMLDRNSAVLEILENEAMEFVLRTYRRFRKRVDFTVVAFSGGKDSQVILDIVSRALHPDQYMVIFTDTTMELPCTLETVEQVREQYGERFPALKFLTARHETPALELWSKFGPPSRMHRWCCSVYKSAPVVRLLQQLKGDGTQARVLLFDGVRAEESQRRLHYLRTATGAKHSLQTNAEVIRMWSTTEVFLYLARHSIDLNAGYRIGLQRVGCAVCPFASEWSEFVLSQAFPNHVAPYFGVLDEHARLLGMTDERNRNEYVSAGSWKKRAGGDGVDTGGTRVDVVTTPKELVGVMSRPRENVLTWLTTVGSVAVVKKEHACQGEVVFKGQTLRFSLRQNVDKEKTTFSVQIPPDPTAREMRNTFVRILNKAAYCIHCGVCQSDCPTGALKSGPPIEIDQSRCTHCGVCLNVSEKGCLMAKSLGMRGEVMGSNTGIQGLGKYLTFGLRKEWLDDFLRQEDHWLENNSLGSKQIEAMLAWLRDAGLIDPKTKEPTSLAALLSDQRNSDTLRWEAIWANLATRSGLVQWYLTAIPWGTQQNKNDLVNQVTSEGGVSPRTADSGMNSLFNMMEHSPLGSSMQLGRVTAVGRQRRLEKNGWAKLSPEGAVYSCYVMAAKLGRREFVLSDLCSTSQLYSLYWLFGVREEALRSILRSAEFRFGADILRVDFAAGLDNVYLSLNMSADAALEIMAGGGPH
jgi:phosphoadenosine phosphosulfate reductase